jgi:hypothetical protein
MEINKLIERRNFLIVGLERKNIEHPKAAEDELIELEKQIAYKTKEALSKAKGIMLSNIQEAKVTIKEDGPFKRVIAKSLIQILEESGLDQKTIKGVFRQGYKIARETC